MSEASEKKQAIKDEEEAAKTVKATAPTPEPTPAPVPHKVVDPKVEAREKAKAARREELNKLITECLAEHGVESNIGIGHQYWGWQNELRGLK